MNGNNDNGASAGAVLRKRWRLAFPVFGLALLLLLGMACSDSNDDQTPEEAYCGDLTDLKTDVENTVNAVLSLDQQKIQDSLNTLQDDVEATKSSGQELRSSDSGQIESAFNNLKSAVQGLGQGGGISANLTAIQTSLNALVNTISSAASTYSCKQ